jgi:hypothetical protein
MGHLVNIRGQRVGKKKQFWSDNLSFFYNRKLLKRMTILFPYLSIILKHLSQFLRKVYNRPFAPMKPAYNIKGSEGGRELVITYNVFDYFESFRGMPRSVWRHFKLRRASLFRRTRDWRIERRENRRQRKRMMYFSESDIRDNFATTVVSYKLRLARPSFPVWIVPKKCKLTKLPSTTASLKAVRCVKAVKRKNNKLSWLWAFKVVSGGKTRWERVRNQSFVSTSSQVKNNLEFFTIAGKYLFDVKSFFHSYPTDIFDIKYLVARHVLAKIFGKRLGGKKKEESWIDKKWRALGFKAPLDLEVMGQVGGRKGSRYCFNYHTHEVYRDKDNDDIETLRKWRKGKRVTRMEKFFVKTAFRKLSDYMYTIQRLFRRSMARTMAPKFRGRKIAKRGVRRTDLASVFKDLGMGFAFFFRSLTLKLRMFKLISSQFWIYIFACFFNGVLDRIINHYNFSRVCIQFSIRDWMISADAIIDYAVREFNKGFSVNFVFRQVTRGLKFLIKTHVLAGFKVCFAGKFSRKQVAVYTWKKRGLVSTGIADASVGYAAKQFWGRWGACGAKIWLQYAKD